MYWREMASSPELASTCQIYLTGAAVSSSISEAEAMARWLKSKGVPRESLVLEEQAFNTVENAWYVCKLLAAAHRRQNAPRISPDLTVITSRFHMARARAMFDPMLDAFEMGSGHTLTSSLTYLGAPDGDGPINTPEQEAAICKRFAPRLQAALRAAKGMALH